MSIFKRFKPKLPIRLSHADRTGMAIYHNIITGGRTLVIVGLNREIPTGSRGMNVDDIDWTVPVLHFADVRTMELTAQALMEVVEEWKVEK